MQKPQYKAGLHFVVATPNKPLDKHIRKAIRSHATKAGGSRLQGVQLHSWISPSRELGRLKLPRSEDTPTQESAASISPRRIGGDFSGLDLPPGVEPYMIQDLVKIISVDKHGVYPYEISFNTHPVERGWFPYMASDLGCLHSMLFSVEVFTDTFSHKSLGQTARFHFGKTLQLLQARLDEFDKTLAISDSTIMIIVFLATAAEIMEDLRAVENHVKGLERIVDMRGGVQRLNIDTNMHVKVCRADLSYALLSGKRPRLFREGTPWDCFIADRNVIQCSHQPHDASIDNFLRNSVDKRLHDAFKDLHAFSCISTLAFQTTHKLSPEMYNEIMISVLYRLTHLSLARDPVQEALRLGLLAASTTLFMQRQFMENPYDHLAGLYRNALLKLRGPGNPDIPTPIVLWLALMMLVVEHKEDSQGDWLIGWLGEIVSRAGIGSWSQAQEMLRSIVWVGFVHDERGKQAFEAAMFGLDKTG